MSRARNLGQLLSSDGKVPASKLTGSYSGTKLIVRPFYGSHGYSHAST
tara:strand:+ start:205 stop:348 length:144 start_codon:yes stop_codon:yes gene_type:complete